MQLSKSEAKAYDILRNNGLGVFRIKDLCLLLNLNKTKAYNIIKSLKKKNIIAKTSKSLYVFFNTDEYVVAVNNNMPSYLSFWTALNYYGWSDQLPKTIYLCTTKYCRKRNGFHYAVVNKKRFFGYTQLGELVIAEKEKAIIDSLFLPKYAGGIAEIQTSIKNALKEIDKKKLVVYALQMESKAVLRRLGFILEKQKFDKQLLHKLHKSIGKGYELLDPALPKQNKYNDTWLLDVNI